MHSSISSILKSFTYTDSVLVKGIKQRALNISIDSDVILKTGSESFTILSEYMKVDRGILDMISFFRGQVPINAHLSVASRKDIVKVLDNVMSTGFTANSCISEQDPKAKSSTDVKILNIVKILSSFPTHRHLFILSDIEELVFLKFLQGYIKEDKSVDFFKTSSFYKKYSQIVNFSKLKKLQILIDAMFIKSDALLNLEKCRSYILSTDSRVSIFDNYLDIAISLVTSKILSKDKFVYFLKYAHDHFGESIEDILSKVYPMVEAKILETEDLKIFKTEDISVNKHKKFWLRNYLLQENEDFNSGFLKAYCTGE